MTFGFSQPSTYLLQAPMFVGWMPLSRPERDPLLMMSQKPVSGSLV